MRRLAPFWESRWGRSAAGFIVPVVSCGSVSRPLSTRKFPCVTLCLTPREQPAVQGSDDRLMERRVARGPTLFVWPLHRRDAMNLEEETFLTAYLDGTLEHEQRVCVESALVSDPRLGDRLRDLASVRD